MTDVPAARFLESATERGSQEILRRVGVFVEACGVDPTGCAQIAHMLAVVLAAAAEHAAAGTDAQMAVIADVMPRDVQLVLQLFHTPAQSEEPCEPIGGFELWISFPRA